MENTDGFALCWVEWRDFGTFQPTSRKLLRGFITISIFYCVWFYRSRQYFKSKVVLHITLIKTSKENHNAIHNASFENFKAKIGRLHSSQSMFEFSLKIVILFKSEAKWSNFRYLKTLWGLMTCWQKFAHLDVSGISKSDNIEASIW